MHIVLYSTTNDNKRMLSASNYLLTESAEGLEVVLHRQITIMVDGIKQLN